MNLDLLPMQHIQDSGRFSGFRDLIISLHGFFTGRHKNVPFVPALRPELLPCRRRPDGVHMTWGEVHARDEKVAARQWREDACLWCVVILGLVATAVGLLFAGRLALVVVGSLLDTCLDEIDSSQMRQHEQQQ
eukprot:SAG22_NODE_7632_length_722_cov_0.937400_1_plen_133_part_00